METTRGRPPKKERLVPIMVLVPQEVKNYLIKAGKVQHKSMSEYAREVLTHFYTTR
jgi:hypothetical protein